MVSTPTPCLRSATTITPSGKYHLGHVLSFRSPIPIFFARDWHFSNVPRPGKLGGQGHDKKSTCKSSATGFVARWRAAPVLRNRRGRMRGTDGSRSRRIEGQAPRAGGSSTRLGTKKTLTRLRSRRRRVAPRDPQFRHRSSRAPRGGARGAAARRRRPPPSRRRRRARPLQRRRRPGRSDGE